MIWPQIKKAEHFVQFYESHEFIVRSVSDYIAQGLLTDETCIIVATREHISEVKQQLAEADFDPDTEAARGNLTFLDARETLETFMIDGWPDAASFNSSIGALVRAGVARGNLRIFGEMVGLLIDDGQSEACVRLEELWEELWSRYHFSLFCAYPIDQFANESGSEYMARICCHHAAVIPAESYISITDPEHRMRAIAFLQQRSKQLQIELETLKTELLVNA